ETLELLEELLLDFDGTVLLVSHDRAFMDNVATNILAFEGEGQVTPYVGGYSDWVRQGGRLPSAPWEQERERQEKHRREAREEDERRQREEAKAQQANKKVKLAYKFQRELDLIPAVIEKLEGEIAALEASIAAPSFYAGEATAITATLEKLSHKQKVLEETMERWMELEAMQEGWAALVVSDCDSWQLPLTTVVTSFFAVISPDAYRQYVTLGAMQHTR
ncbi:MAG: hypothetical protein ACTH7H_08440, partial [Cobetia crustatorum]